MNSSNKVTKRRLSIWQFSFLISVVYLVGLAISHQTTVFEKIYWSGYELQYLSKSDQWTDSNRFKIGETKGIQTVRFFVQIDDSEHWRKPVGLMLGGPFSAEVRWSGQAIGRKGRVGRTPEEEIAGTIDSVIFIPSDLLTVGQHQIELDISTQHLLLHDESVFHYIWLAPYREGGKRDLRYYTAPLIILSALLVLSFQSFRIGYNAGNPMHTGLGIFGFFITLLLLSEVSRAIINYAYPYHELRGVIGWVSNTAAAITLIYTSYKVTNGQGAKSAMIISTLLYVASHFIAMNSGDMRMALDFLLLSLGPTALFIWLRCKGKVSYLSTLPIFWLACVASNYLSTGLFLDSFQFISALILIGGAWVWVYVDFENVLLKASAEQVSVDFILRNSGEEQVIPVRDCIVLKSEGNYTNLLLKDGSSKLHQDGLGALIATNSQGFVRVHKSYAVNITEVAALKSAAGSKYWLLLSNQQKIPVSRYRVTELRLLLSGADN